jgi:hypothetical protein
MGRNENVLLIPGVMKMHIYNAFREVMIIPQINQLFLVDGLGGVEIFDQVLVVEKQRSSHFVVFS